MLAPDEKRERVYEQITPLFLRGKHVLVKEHKIVFPAVTVGCEDIYILTDIISLEQWWAKKKKERS